MSVKSLIQSLRELEAKATKGPWERSACVIDGALYSKGGEREALANAELIAESRNHLIQLLDAIELRDRVIERMRNKLDEYCDQRCCGCPEKCPACQTIAECNRLLEGEGK